MVKKFISFMRNQILMPSEKTQEIRRRKKIMKEACEQDQVLRKIFDEEYAKEKKEAFSARRKVQMVIISGIVLLLLFCLVRWAIPRLFRGMIGTFILEAAMLVFAIGIWLAVVRTYLETLQEAYLGAEIEASNRYDELRKAEEASKKAARNVDLRFADQDLTDSYVRGARQTRAKRTKKD